MNRLEVDRKLRAFLVQEFRLTVREIDDLDDLTINELYIRPYRERKEQEAKMLGTNPTSSAASMPATTGPRPPIAQKIDSLLAAGKSPAEVRDLLAANYKKRHGRDLPETSITGAKTFRG